MTEVLVLRKFPGGKPGAILPLDDRTQRQIDAGNAKLIPSERDTWQDDPAPTPVEPLRVSAPSNSFAEDEDTASEDERGSHPVFGEDSW